MSGSVELRGWDELDAALRKLPNKVAGRALTNAANEGARVLRDDMRSRVPVKSGRLRRAIRVIRRQTGVEWGVKVSIGVKGARAWLANILEFGAAPHTIEPTPRKKALLLGVGIVVESVDHPGIPPHPFILPAYDTKKEETLRTVRRRLGAEIDKAVAESRTGR